MNDTIYPTILERIPLLVVFTLAASAGCSSSSPSPMNGDAAVGIDSDGSVVVDDADVGVVLRRVDTSRYLPTVTLNAAPGIIILNGLNLGPLTVASIGPDELSELNSETLSTSGETIGDVGRQVLAYAYSCALPATSSMQLEIGGETWEFSGLLGLAPEWETGACDVGCQEWVSACILARTNQFGTEVRLSLRGEHPALATTPATRSQYSLREGSFYGNIFTGAAEITGNAYACAGGRGGAMWELTDRFCSVIGDGCPITTVADCNFDEFSCDTGFEACTSWTACSNWNTDGLPTTCYSQPHKCQTQAPVGDSYTRIITAYLEQPVATANGICEAGEAGEADCADHWAVRYGSGCHEDSGGLSVHDATGNIAIVGRFIGDIDFGNGNSESSNFDDDIDLFVASVDADGATNWSVRVDAQNQGMIRSVATDSNGDVIVVGHFSGGIDLGPGVVTVSGMSYFVAKYDGITGAHLWSQVLESNGFWANNQGLDALPDIEVAIDSNNGVVTATTIRGTVDLGLGAGNPASSSVLRSDLLIASYGTDGVLAWHTTLDGDDDEDVSSLALDSQDNIILGGSFKGTINIGTTVLSNPQGGTLLRTEGFVAKLSSLGAPLWGAHLESVGVDYAESSVLSLAVGANDDIVLSGHFLGAVSVAGSATIVSVKDLGSDTFSRDGMVAKLNSAGVLGWAKSFGDNRSDSAMEVAWNGSDSYVVATRITADYGTVTMVEGTPIDSGDNGDIVLIRYLGDGTAQSVNQRGGPVSEAPKGLFAKGNRVVMTGQFMGTLRFSGTYLTNSGGSSQTGNPQDIFLTTIDNLP